MTVDLFCPAKVHFLLHISRSTPVSYFVNKYHLDHLHQGPICHISIIRSLIPNSIVNLRDGRQCWYLESSCKLSLNWFGNGIWASQKQHFHYWCKHCTALKKHLISFLGLKELPVSSKYGLDRCERLAGSTHVNQLQQICPFLSHFLSNTPPTFIKKVSKIFKACWSLVLREDGYNVHKSSVECLLHSVIGQVQLKMYSIYCMRKIPFSEGFSACNKISTFKSSSWIIPW